MDWRKKIMAISEDSLLALPNLLAAVDQICPMGTNMFACGGQCGNLKATDGWVVFISYGDGKTPIAAFPREYYERYARMRGLDKEIYRKGLLDIFALHEQDFHDPYSDWKGKYYRLSTIPPGYGHNWQVVEANFFDIKGGMLPDEIEEAKVYVVGKIVKTDGDGSALSPHGLRVVTSPKLAAKIICGKPEDEMVRNDQRTKKEIVDRLIAGEVTETKWRPADYELTTQVQAAIPIAVQNKG
jgi:hypothetical protein